MKKNMKLWLEELKNAENKKPMPILSFPAVSLLGISVSELISSEELQVKGMKAIADRTDVAASVSFMDLSLEAECFGARIVVSDDEVPTIKEPVITDEDGINALEIPKVGCGRTNIYINAIRRASELITDRPVLAGMIGPFSLAARLFDMTEIMMLCFDDPDTVNVLLDKVTAFLVDYARAYKEAGANGIVMAEPVAGLLSPNLEAEFSGPFVKRIVDAVQDDSFIVIYHNCGGNVHLMLPSITSTGAAAFHFGNAIDLEHDILTKLDRNTVVMGNVDPAGVLKLGTPDSVRTATLELLERCSVYEGFVLSSGCDIPPMTPWENLDAFFGAAKEFYEG